jgi:hypothetical protein
VEDYTNKYKGEQVELALFGGEYQEGTLTAYCSIEDVPHVELNGHILVPLQNALLQCSSRGRAHCWPHAVPEGDDHDPAVGEDWLRRRGSSRRPGISARPAPLRAARGAVRWAGWMLGAHARRAEPALRRQPAALAV